MANRDPFFGLLNRKVTDRQSFHHVCHDSKFELELLVRVRETGDVHLWHLVMEYIKNKNR